MIRIWCVLLTVFSLSLQANPLGVNPAQVKDSTLIPKLEFLQNYQGNNQIKILNNRFRVDHHVDEIMMLFFRQEGSSPVVLVQPDGSKLYPRDANAKTIEWHAALNYDLIKLRNPMPGPWQAVGKILPESKILVLTDVELRADLLPDQIFQYERIKAQARIVNADQVITDGNFKDVITLKAQLFPSSDPDAENFGSDIYRVGDFADDGREFDEKPRDGIFTLSYYFNLGFGEWVPNYRIIAELFTRELTQEPIRILPSPVSFILTRAEGEERYHYVEIVVESDLMEPYSLLIQGDVVYPNMDKETFTMEQRQERKIKIFNGEYGTFRINLEVFGTMKNGREFVLQPPTYQFVTVEPEVMSDILDTPVIEPIVAEPEVYVEPEKPIPVAFLVVVNLVILLFGLVIIWLVVLKKPIPNIFAKLKFKKAAKEPAQEEPKAKEKPAEKAPTPASSDDILDLSLPDD